MPRITYDSRDQLYCIEQHSQEVFMTFEQLSELFPQICKALGFVLIPEHMSVQVPNNYREERIYEYIKSHGGCTLSDVWHDASKNGYGSKKTIEALLYKMMEKGTIKAKSRKRGYSLYINGMIKAQ